MLGTSAPLCSFASLIALSYMARLKAQQRTKELLRLMCLPEAERYEHEILGMLRDPFDPCIHSSSSHGRRDGGVPGKSSAPA